MKHKQLHSRLDKIKFLKNIKEGKATINELIPLKLEMWQQYMDEPGIYINEVTGEQITTAEMEMKEQTKGNDVLFVTVLHRGRHEQER
jgi:hypothetical protein